MSVEDVLTTAYGEHSPAEDSAEAWAAELERADAETQRADA